MRLLRNISLLFALTLATQLQAQTWHVLYTTDVHGSIFPYNFVTEKPTNNSLSNIYSYIKSVRDTAENVILLDNGDNLQGTPAVYYYNFVDTAATHIVPSVYNFMKYDAVVVGNHDIETTHAVYDRVFGQYEMPVLAANAVRTSDGAPYFTSSIILQRGEQKIAVIGLITPHIPYWLPESYWSGMRFNDMIESAQKWVGIVKATEKPDAVIGLFHAGYDYTYGGQTADTYRNENASQLVAERVDGFDAILIGHDHKLYNKVVKSPSGKDVCILDAGVGARNIGHLTINFGEDGTVKCSAEIVPAATQPQSEEFDDMFEEQFDDIEQFTKDVVCVSKQDIYAYESLFGNAAFTDMVHEAMLRHTGAEISISAPLLINATIEKGDISIGEMFGVYKYENLLNVIELTGEEIKNYLEFSYDLWVSNPDSTGHLLKIDNKNRLVNNYYNFDSAMGIRYTVNPYNSKGYRVEIESMADGTPFDPKRKYTVAMNSYRCNGGGGHLEKGAGIDHDKLKERIVKTLDSDLRSIIIKDWQAAKEIDPKAGNNWHFAPEEKLKQIIEQDKKLFEPKTLKQ